MNIKKIMSSAFLTLISMNAYTNSPEIDVLTKINNDMRETRKKDGFNPDGGVIIVPSSRIQAPATVKRQWMKERLEQKEKGFSSIYSDRAEELFQLADTVEYKYQASQKNKDKNSSIFRKDLSEINMAYKFTSIPNQYVSKLYGFAACNTFSGGWTGVVEFFNHEKIGICAFTENNVTLTHQAAKVDEDIVSYDINNKITTINVEGNNKSGYLYRVEWFDDNFFRTLECANIHYLIGTTNAVIALAKHIDEQ